MLVYRQLMSFSQMILNISRGILLIQEKSQIIDE